MTTSRQSLCVLYLSLAKSKAKRWHERHPWLDRGDVYGVAYLALSLAAHRYNAALGSFGTYAAYTIQHALQDLLVSEAKRERALMAARNRPIPREAGSDRWHIDLSARLRALTAQQRTVLELIFDCGYTQHQVAARLGLAQSRVCKLKRQALESLREAA